MVPEECRPASEMDPRASGALLDRVPDLEMGGWLDRPPSSGFLKSELMEEDMERDLKVGCDTGPPGRVVSAANNCRALGRSLGSGALQLTTTCATSAGTSSGHLKQTNPTQGAPQLPDRAMRLQLPMHCNEHQQCTRNPQQH